MLAEVAFSISDIVVGLLATGAVVWQARKTRRETKQELDTGNAHTAGQSLSRLEDMAWRHEQRLDAIEVRLIEGSDQFDEIDARFDRHEAETRPIRDWAVEQMEKREEQQDG